jgi:hypothetical protein
LAEILDEHAERDVHWMKIDVEGFEDSVIQSWRGSSVRPWIVLVESTEPMTPTPNHAGWEPDLLALGYRFAYFDGLNRFYISNDHADLERHFTSGPNFFDQFKITHVHWLWQPAPPAAPPTPTGRSGGGIWSLLNRHRPHIGPLKRRFREWRQRERTVQSSATFDVPGSDPKSFAETYSAFLKALDSKRGSY